MSRPVFCAAILALSAASDYAAPEAQGSDAYAPEYEAAQYEQPEYNRGPKVSYFSKDTCFGGCSPAAPCFSKSTGKCVAMRGVGSETYTSVAQPMDLEYGAGSDAASQADEGYGEGRQLSSSSCPAGYTDSSWFAVRNSLVFWIGFILLFIPALAFTAMMFQKDTQQPNYDMMVSIIGTEAVNERWQKVLQARLVAAVVCLVASLAYLTMASGNGFSTKCDGRNFYYARYIDWAVTTPLMLYDLAKLSGCDRFTMIFLVGTDILMILAGLIGGLLNGPQKWAFFAFGMLVFLPVLYFLLNLGSTPPVVEGSTNSQPLENALRLARNLTVLTWLGYPVIWILAEGTGYISVESEAVAYMILDILAKSVFGFVIASANWGFQWELSVAVPATRTVAANSALDGTYQMTSTLSPEPGTMGPGGTNEVYNGSMSKPVWVKKGGSGQILWTGAAWKMENSDAAATSPLYQTDDTIDPPTAGWGLTMHPDSELERYQIIDYVQPPGMKKGVSCCA